MTDLTEIQFRKQIAYVLLAIWVGVVVLISVCADLGRIDLLGSWVPQMGAYDVYLHFLLMGLLGFFATLADRSEFRKGRLAISRIAFALICLSMMEETSQLFRAQRGFSFLDMGANVSGILFFSFIGRKVKNLF